MILLINIKIVSISFSNLYFHNVDQRFNIINTDRLPCDANEHRPDIAHKYKKSVNNMTQLNKENQV